MRSVLTGLCIGAAIVVSAFLSSQRTWQLIVVLATLAALSSSLRAAATITAMGAAAAVGTLWPIPCLVAAAIWCTGPSVDRSALQAWRRITWRAMMLAVIVGLASAGIAAAIEFSPGGSGTVYLSVEQPSTILVILAVAGMAAFNALGEEILWRGVLADVLPRPQLTLAYAVQIAAFGAAHYWGIPSGAWGMLLAGVYSGVVFAILRRYGAMVALLTHFATDLALFAIMAATATYAFHVRRG